MKSKVPILLLLVVLVACQQKSTKDKELNNQLMMDKIAKQNINKIVLDTIDNSMMLLGRIDEKGLNGDDFIEWYQENYKAHELDTTSIKEINKKIKQTKIKMFMGTWCSDSQREVPAFYKILHQTDFDLNNLEVIAVSQEKDTPNKLEEGFAIEYVPTIIFYKNDGEIGRYVELAQETLEKDILAILNESGYKHYYEE